MASPPSNPFDGFDAYSTVAPQPPPVQQQQQQQQIPPEDYNPFAFSPPVAAAAVASSSSSTTVPPNAIPLEDSNPFAIAQGGPMMQQQQQQQQPYQQHHHHHQQQQQQQLVPAMPSAMSPWAMQQPPQPQQFLAPMAPQQQQPQPRQFLAPMAPAASPWATVQPGGVVPPPPSATAVPPAAPVFDSIDALFGQQQMQLHVQQTNPYAVPATMQQQQQQQQQQPIEIPLFDFEKSSNNDNDESLLAEGLALIDVELDDEDVDATKNLDDRRKDGDFLGSGGNDDDDDDGGGSFPLGAGGGLASSRPSPQKQRHRSWDRNPDLAPPPPFNPARRHAEYLAVNSAPATSSPLPRHDLVHHAGYVLSRISFRTVLLRKWKQTFWIQYGPCQLLFFRTFVDYEDWLNNPYHTAKAREFLVKLRVDFVGDLKKASVMGYQVTQIRRKPYGRNTMLHFKLERWMDYGPTIAAAFAAREEDMINSPSNRRRNGDGEGDEDGFNTTNDVSALRKIILGCMRNARDFALIASREQQFRSDSGTIDVGGMRGRYDDAERDRDARVPASSGNMGYHQAFSAESSPRRPLSQMEQQADSSDRGSESSRDRDEVEKAKAVGAVVDLLG